MPAENSANAFQVIKGDFVTTEDGTGIVHAAPTFGSDDYKVANEAGVPGMLVKDKNGNLVPLVNLQGSLEQKFLILQGCMSKTNTIAKKKFLKNP